MLLPCAKSTKCFRTQGNEVSLKYIFLAGCSERQKQKKKKSTVLLKAIAIQKEENNLNFRSKSETFLQCYSWH